MVTLSHRKVDHCCVQETRYGDGHCHLSFDFVLDNLQVRGHCIGLRPKANTADRRPIGNNLINNIIGNSKGTVNLKMIAYVYEVKQVSNMINLVKILFGQRVSVCCLIYNLQCISGML